MASTFYSDQYYLSKQGRGAGGNVKVLVGSYEFTSITVIADIVTLFTMPKGFTPLYGWLVGDPIDADATPLLQIGIGVTGTLTKYLASGTTVDAAQPGAVGREQKITNGINLPLQGTLMTEPPTEWTVNTDLLLSITAAAETTGTGTLTVIMCGVQNDHRVVN